MSNHSLLEILPKEVLNFIADVHETEVNANERLIENMYFIFYLSPGRLSLLVKTRGENADHRYCHCHDFVDVCTETDLQHRYLFFSHQMEVYCGSISFPTEFISEQIRIYESHDKYICPYFMFIKKGNHSMDTLHNLAINCACLIYLLYWETAEFEWMTDYDKETLSISNLEYVAKLIVDNFECFTRFYDTLAEFHEMANKKGFLQGTRCSSTG